MTLAPDATALIDRYGRSKRKLRVSLTDRCNFRCPYCLPEKPQWLKKDQLLSAAERQRLLLLFVERFGISEIRLTGGEPLLSTELFTTLEFLGGLRVAGLKRIALTSNASLLESKAAALRDAGLDDLNVSLDALDAQRFAELSGGQPIAPVLAGIGAAQAAGLPLKVNTVLMRGRNEDQILPLVAWAEAQQVTLRFIEFMPLDSGSRWNRQQVVTEADVLEQIGRLGAVTAMATANGPASYYRIAGHSQKIGVIPTVSRPFCGDCDRLRLTASGELFACLFSAQGADLRSTLRGGDNAQLIEMVRRCVWQKDEGYAAKPGYTERPISMHGLGG